MQKLPFVAYVAAASLAAASLGCSGTADTVGGTTATGSAASNPANPTPTGGGSAGGGSTGATGLVSVRLTDSPFSDAKALLVTFSDVSIHAADPGDWKTVPFVSGTSRTCDLKKLTGATDVLGVGPLAAGHYTQIRLTVTSAAIYFDNPSATGPCAPAIAPPAGRSAPVDIPSGEIKLNNEFTLTGAGTTITLDFDGDQSVKQTGSGNGNGNGKGNSNGSDNAKYLMTPVIRILSVG